MIINVKGTNSTHVFGPGQLETLKKKTLESESCSAIFINLKMLTGEQLKNLQEYFDLPVYDR